MIPRIEMLAAKKLIGKSMKMSLADNTVGELWKWFMPRRKEITNNLNSDLISMQQYDASLNFDNFNLQTVFEKWAAVEVADFDNIPTEMETCILPGGLYAVFLHKGPPSEGEKTFRYIFGTWLPQSNYLLDNRPHFEILGEKYKHESPDSEEEIWIPIVSK